MKIGFTNEKGNVKVSIRKNMRDQILNRLKDSCGDFKGEIVKNATNGFSLCCGEDIITGQPVWAHVQITLNMVDPAKIK